MPLPNSRGFQEKRTRMSGDKQQQTAVSGGSDPNCYHCGLPIPPGVEISVEVASTPRALCCEGCRAVAQAIVDNGLTDYYRARDALPESPREALPDILQDLALYNHREFQKSFVRELGPNEREASLILEGITCAACIWLNEQHLARLPGVLAADINYATRRARVRWDETRVQLSDILGAVAAIGYRAYPYDAARNEEISRRERRDAMWRLWVAGFGMMQVMMYAYPTYIAGEGDIRPDLEQLLRWASLFLTLPVVIYSAAPFFRNAWRDARLKRVGMDVPVALGVGSAFLASVWATVTGQGDVYFDSVVMFIFFLLGGRYLEMGARQKAVAVTEGLTKLLPAFAERLPAYPAQGEPVKVVVADLQVGDVVLVRPGEIIPADGAVLEGNSAANEALLSGESRPVQKSPGSEVTGGSINMDSPLVLQVTQVGEETRLSAIIRLMERAVTEKPRIVEVADRIAGHFVAALLLVALATAVFWSWHDASRALAATVAVLVISCPCALSLATPIALTVISGVLARHGMLVTRGQAVEGLAQATCFVFDKTGTLTTGQMTVDQTRVLGSLPEAACRQLAARLEATSEHPIGDALRRGITADDARLDCRNQPGAGVEAESEGRCYRIGRPEFVAELVGQPLPQAGADLGAQGDTVVALGREGEWLACFRLRDELRPEAAGLIAALKAAGRETRLLSGDAEEVVSRVARELGLDGFMARATPEQKKQAVAAWQAAGKVVAMVGDGVNDAPVLAQAQVSVAMGRGAQLARGQADFILLSDNLDGLRLGVDIARRGLRLIRQNLVWAVVYNVVALPLAVMGLITPWLAGIGMSASSLLVVLNSLRLQKTRGRQKEA